MLNSLSLSHASWIAAPSVGGPQCGVVAPCLRKSFDLSRPVQAATLSITALGLYECEINGRNVSDFVLAPGWTNYDRRVHVQSFDVSQLLQIGENAMGAILGDGWYCGFLAWKSRQLYGDRPKFIAQLDLTYADGTTDRFVSDQSWKTAGSAILQNDLLAGEIHDARLEQPGWSSGGFDDSTWLPVMVIPAPDIALETSPAPPMRRIQELKPVSVQSKLTDGKWITQVDFGQNFSGRVRMTVSGATGQTLTLRHAEMLNPDGTIYVDNLRGIRATDFYTCREDGAATWEPVFTFHGFRYVEVTGLNKDQPFSLVGVVLHSDMEVTGSFSCSNPLLNKLQQNILWGQKSNFLDVPTDCPQRNERLGWTGDAQVFVRTAAFNMDIQGFFHKWVQDLRDAQKPNGGVPAVAPDRNFLGDLTDGGPAWSDATIICPWTIYLCYDDRKILADHYDSMRRYLDFLAAHRCKDFIRSHPDVDDWGGFGDWLALDGSGKTEGCTPRDLIGTAFYAYDAELMCKIAGILGHTGDALRYASLHEDVVRAFRHRFVTPEGLIASGTQTAYVLALRFNLIPEEARAVACRQLVRDIESRDFHLSTGFVGTPHLLDVLTEHGRLDVAYRLLEQETFPSWLFPVKNGATTIWERWDGWTPEKGFQDKGMNSFNHYAYGAVGAWMYRTVAGLDLDPDLPGYKHIIFRPRPGGSLTSAEASLTTAHGKVAISWEQDAATFRCEITVPVGCRATFFPPYDNPSSLAFGPGNHPFSQPVRS